ncbi:MAG: TonB family protein [Hyphomonadaceae bacterium]
MMRRFLLGLAFALALLMGAPVSAQTWVERPAAEDFERYYPAWALWFGVEGRVRLQCVVGAGGEMTDCRVLEETPAGWGFGAAALRLTQHFRASETMADGRSMIGGRINIPIRFQVTAD